MDITGWIIAGVLVLALSSLYFRSTRKTTTRVAPQRRKVVVDGTNVLFWREEKAQLETLKIVVKHLRRSGFDPVVFLDASSRHHIGDTSLSAQKFAKRLGLPERHVTVCPARTEADQYILDFARKNKLSIVSNDRFRDRPAKARNIKLIKGRFEGKRLVLKGL